MKEAYKDAYRDDPTGNWNFSEHYSEQLIFDWIKKADDYLTLTEFGALGIVDDLINNKEEDKDAMKLKGYDWLLAAVTRVYENSKFAIKNEKDIKELENTYKDLIELNGKKNLVRREYMEEDRKVTKIVKEPFEVCLKEVRSYLMNIKEKLNRSNLIFIHTEKFDPKQYKKELMNKMAETG
jgi:hypothetical protein